MKKLTTYLSLFILLLALGACGGDSATGPEPDPDSDPDPDPTTGSVEVTISTDGSDIDEDGYTITVDGGNGESVESSDTITINNLEEGAHDLELTGMADNCTVDGSNPQTVNITAGQTASAGFDVTCSAASTPETVFTGDFTYGFEMDVDGTRAIVGEPGNSENSQATGAAYIYELQGSEWVQTAQLIAGDGEEEDLFGHSVAISGDRAVVGAILNDEQNRNDGAVYVFELQGGSWVQTQKLLGDDFDSRDRTTFDEEFGEGLDIDGNTIVVGSHRDGGGRFNIGAIYIFELQNGQFSMTQKLRPVDVEGTLGTTGLGIGGDHFGKAVVISGNTIAASSPYDRDNGTSSGSVYIFDKPRNQWVETQKLLPSDGSQDDFFGLNLSIAGNRLAVGSYTNNSVGAAYIFENQGGTWSETQKLTASDGEIGDQFGFDLALRPDGNALVVGATNVSSESHNAGAAYLFEFSSGSFSQQNRIIPSEPQPNTYFGSSMAFGDNFFVVGATSYVGPIFIGGKGGIGGHNSNAGRMHIFEQE